MPVAVVRTEQRDRILGTILGALRAEGRSWDIIPAMAGTSRWAVIPRGRLRGAFKPAPPPIDDDAHAATVLDQWRGGAPPAGARRLPVMIGDRRQMLLAASALSRRANLQTQNGPPNGRPAAGLVGRLGSGVISPSARHS